MKKLTFLSTFLLLVAAVSAGEMPEGYYNAADGKSGDALRSALMGIIGEHTTIEYSSLPTQCYAASSEPSDFYNGSNNLLEDIYSSCQYTSSQAGTSAPDCGQGWNKEHSLPKSWFGGEKSPMYSDAFHIYPTDIKTNSNRAALPYGETDASLACSDYGYGAVGSSNRSGYTGQIFEPRETATTNYKGDLARGYFYMLTCYMNINFTQAAGGTVMFTYTNSVADFTDYGLDLMMEWHREDPVSEKERIRNNAIYAHQGNRNPFIDYPCLAEYIWGNKKGEAVDFSKLVSSYDADFDNTENQCGCEIATTDPTITSPKSAVAFGAVAVNKATTQTITVKGLNLTDAVTLTLAGTNSALFGLSATTVSAADALAGKSVTITYTPTTEGEHTATLTLKSNGAADVTVTLTGNGATLYKVTYDAGSGTPDVIASNETTIGGGVVLTTATVPTTCSDWTFAGWTTAAVSETQTAPTLYAAGDTYYPTSNCTLYAVYKTGGYTKVTTLNDGDVVVIYYPTNKLALTATASNTKLTGVATTVENGSITSLGDGAITLTVEVSGENIRFKNGDNYLICPSTGNGLSFGTATDYADWMFEESGGMKYVKNVNAKYNSYSIYLEYYSGFTTYTAKTFSSAYQFEFYKFDKIAYTSAPDCKVCTLTGITLNTDAVAKTFTAGDKFSSDGLVATANYSDCESRTITPTVTKPDMSSDGSKTVTISYTENGTTKSTSYTITVEPKPTYTITWSVNGTKTQETYTQGDALVLPITPTACEGKLFVGWTATKDYTNETTAPADLFTEASGTVTANKTYYAVFGKQSETIGKTDVVTTLTMTDLAATSGTMEGFTIKTDKSSGSTNPAYNTTDKDLRIYAKGTLTISSTKTITAIEFEISAQGRKRLTTIAANTGSMTSVDTLLTRWEGSATSVTFTVGSTATYGSESKKAGQLCFTAVKITTEGTGSVTTITNYTTTCTNEPATTYAITFKNGDETLQSSQVAYGTTPTYSGATPTKAATAQYEYTFSGWNPEIAAVTGEATYTAQFTQKVRSYTVTFVDYDGKTLDTQSVEYGTTPTYSGATPTKAATAQYEYTFSGWNPEIAAVTGEATYTAQFTQKVRSYTVTFVDYDGKTLDTQSVEYGTTPTYSGATPTKAATAQYEYTFSGWNPEIAAVTGEATYTAQFTQKVRSYTVTFVDYDGTTLGTQSVEYGRAATAPENPTRAGYIFAGWDKAFDNITEAIIVTATYRADQATAIDQMERDMPAIYAHDGRIECDADYQIFDLLGRNVTRLNGQLNGIYIVKIGDKTQKVVARSK